MKAAGVLIVRHGRILSLWREDGGGAGLPCGTVEPGESAEEAAIREVREETGFEVALEGVPYVAMDGPCEVTIFRARICGGAWLESGEGTPCWEDPAVLVGRSAAFAAFNRGLLAWAGIGIGPERPRLLVDMDGVLAGFEERRAEVMRARGAPWVPVEEITEFYGAEVYRRRFGDAAAIAADRLMREPGFFAALPAVPGGLEAVQRLAARWDVRICSSPLRGAPGCMEEKRAWLAAHLGEDWARAAILTRHKARIGGDVLVDDRPDFKQLIAEAGECRPRWEHLLFRRPWNRASKAHDAVAEGWPEVERWAERRAEQAERRAGQAAAG